MTAHAALSRLPFGLAGSVYRSPMPFGTYDSAGAIWPAIEAAGIEVIVPLASAEECIEKSGRDLHGLYREQGLAIIPFPIEDYAAPDAGRMQAYATVVDTVLAHAKAGRHVLVHCSAGVGRTGTFLASMAIRELALDSAAAIRWVRAHIRGAVETDEQEDFLRLFAEKQGHAD